MSWYSFGRFISKIAFALFNPISAEGLENLPAQGSFILCSNHINLRDPLALAVICPRQIRFLAKRELFNFPPLRYIMTRLGAISVDRGQSDLGAIRACLSALNNGEALGIFPEGHRFRDGRLHEFKTGTALLVLRARVSVVPVRISSDYRPFHKVKLRFGAPFSYTPTPGLSGSALLSECTELLRARVAEL